MKVIFSLLLVCLVYVGAELNTVGEEFNISTEPLYHVMRPRIISWGENGALIDYATSDAAPIDSNLLILSVNDNRVFADNMVSTFFSPYAVDNSIAMMPHNQLLYVFSEMDYPSHNLRVYAQILHREYGFLTPRSSAELILAMADPQSYNTLGGANGALTVLTKNAAVYAFFNTYSGKVSQCVINIFTPSPRAIITTEVADAETDSGNTPPGLDVEVISPEHYVIAWTRETKYFYEDLNATLLNYEIFGRLYSSSTYLPLTDEFLVSEFTNQTVTHDIDLSIIGVNDTFVITWVANYENATNFSGFGCEHSAIHAQLYAYERSGVTRLGDEVVVNEDLDDGCQSTPSLSYFPGTRFFVVSWQDADSESVWARTFRIRDHGIFANSDPLLVSQTFTYNNESLMPSVAATSYNTAIVAYLKVENSSYAITAGRLVRDNTIKDPFPNSGSILESFFF